jgi:hypothetical protein
MTLRHSNWCPQYCHGSVDHVHYFRHSNSTQQFKTALFDINKQGRCQLRCVTIYCLANICVIYVMRIRNNTEMTL